MKKPKPEKIGKIAKRCDDKLRDYLLAQTDYKCEICNQVAGVVHHFHFKSQAKHLQFELENLVPLCHICHSKFHRFGGSQSATMVGKLIKKRGQEWFDKLEIMRNDRPSSSYWSQKYLYQKEAEIDELTNIDY